MPIHNEPSPLAGKTVKVNFHKGDGTVEVVDFAVEDWWDRVSGKTWRLSAHEKNWAAVNYGRRVANRLPLDNEVLYGKVGALGYLVHASEITGTKESKPERMKLHAEPSPYAGKMVKMRAKLPAEGSAFRAIVTGQKEVTVQVEDWWDRAHGGKTLVECHRDECHRDESHHADGAVLAYVLRAAIADLPYDNEILFGYLDRGGLPLALHVSEVLGVDEEAMKRKEAPTGASALVTPFDAPTREAYNRKFRQSVEHFGFGMESGTVHPCPFCASPGFQRIKTVEVKKRLAEESTCSKCGRSSKVVFEGTEDSYTFKIVQTGGPRPPEYLLGLFSGEAAASVDVSDTEEGLSVDITLHDAGRIKA